MSGRGTLTILKDVTLTHPIDEAQVEVRKGEELPVIAWSESDGRMIFTLEDQKIDGRNTWAIAKNDCAWVEAQPECDLILISTQKEKKESSNFTPKWNVSNIKLDAPIIENGNFTWSEATHNGTRMPPNQEVVEAIVRIAKATQEVRNRLRLPMTVTSWYRTPQANRNCGGAKFSRHLVGDALDFVCEGMTGQQLYQFLDPWWEGGLGRYPRFFNLIHLDVRGTRARWGR